MAKKNERLNPRAEETEVESEELLPEIGEAIYEMRVNSYRNLKEIKPDEEDEAGRNLLERIEESYLTARRVIVPDDIFSKGNRQEAKVGKDYMTRREQQIVHDAMKVMLSTKDTPSRNAFGYFERVLILREEEQRGEENWNGGKQKISDRQKFEALFPVLRKYGVTLTPKQVYTRFNSAVGKLAHESDVFMYVDRRIADIAKNKFRGLWVDLVKLGGKPGPTPPPTVPPTLPPTPPPTPTPTPTSTPTPTPYPEPKGPAKFPKLPRGPWMSRETHERVHGTGGFTTMTKRISQMLPPREEEEKAKAERAQAEAAARAKAEAEQKPEKKEEERLKEAEEKKKTA